MAKILISSGQEFLEADNSIQQFSLRQRRINSELETLRAIFFVGLERTKQIWRFSACFLFMSSLIFNFAQRPLTSSTIRTLARSTSLAAPIPPERHAITRLWDRQ